VKKVERDNAVRPSAYTVKSLVKALSILTCLTESERSSLTLTEMSRKLHLHVSTVHRLLTNLVRQGFVEPDPAAGGYRLGFRVLRMGLRVLDRLDFRRVAEPILQALNQQSQETVHLAILQTGAALTIERYESPHPVGLEPLLGNRVPLHATGVGKCLLAWHGQELLDDLQRTAGFPSYTPSTLTTRRAVEAELDRIRAMGYAVDNEECVEGLRCVAAPIFDRKGRAVAAFSVAGPTSRVTPERVPELSRWVVDASREIAYRLGSSLQLKARASAGPTSQ
jgi:DNA-binding IclR family transcriptional regulator